MIIPAKEAQEMSRTTVIHQAINKRVTELAKTGQCATIIEYHDPLYSCIRDSKKLQKELRAAGYSITNFDEFDDPALGIFLGWFEKDDALGELKNSLGVS